MTHITTLRTVLKAGLLSVILLHALSCDRHESDQPEASSSLTLPQLAEVFTHIPLEQEHLREVHAAVSSSVDHGYDEEYTMASLFTSPGAGVGSDALETKASTAEWSHPLRALLEDYFESSIATRSGAPGDAQAFIESLVASDAQIYWPYSSEWDGSSYPVITFDPGTDVSTNIGYALSADGAVEEVTVTEEMARLRPVWVMNSNDDSRYMTLEMLRRQDPSWGTGGGITIVPQPRTAGDEKLRTLILKDFVARRNYDSWFAGASEFWVKTGMVESFTASTEAELRLYTPTITDFMVVVRRDQVGLNIPFNAVLVSDWTDQVDNMAFMIIEDDGGTKTTWNCSATVKIQSKSYGFDISLPFNSRDDIVWRGMISRRYFETYNDVRGHFGDVYLTFSII